MRQANICITDRDLELLGFTAEHRLVLADHVRMLLGTSLAASERRLRDLVRAGMLSRRRLFERRPPCYQITRDGLALVGSRLAPPRLDLRSYDHDAGLAWLWLAARAGRLGAVTEVISERTMRSRDAAKNAGRDPLGVRLGGVGPRGRPRLHYPDLLLHTASGHLVAVELELSSKGTSRRERILAGYAGDPRIDAVLYLVERPRLGSEISAAATRLGISRMVHVQWVVRAERAPGRPDNTPVAERTPVAQMEATR